MENINNNEMESNLTDDMESELINEQNSEIENDFLSSLDDELTDNDSDTSAENNAMLLKQGEMTATALLGVSEGLIKQFGHKDFAFEPSQMENVASSAAPLFVKYGGELPPWLAQYKEELLFLFATGTLCFTSVSQVKALNKADKDKEKALKDKEKKEQVTDAAN